jgi:hypothetical protein
MGWSGSTGHSPEPAGQIRTSGLRRFGKGLSAETPVSCRPANVYLALIFKLFKLLVGADMSDKWEPALTDT